MKRNSLCVSIVAAIVLVSTASDAAAQHGWVLDHQKISDTEGDFTGELGFNERRLITLHEGVDHV